MKPAYTTSDQHRKATPNSAKGNKSIPLHHNRAQKPARTETEICHCRTVTAATPHQTRTENQQLQHQQLSNSQFCQSRATDQILPALRHHQTTEKRPKLLETDAQDHLSQPPRPEISVTNNPLDSTTIHRKCTTESILFSTTTATKEP